MKPLETTEYVDPKLVLAAGKEYLGVRYVHAARTKYGCDCVGYFYLVLKHLGHEMANAFSDVKTYTRYAQGQMLENELCKHMVEIDPYYRRSGDLALFYAGKRLHHVGILEWHKERHEYLVMHADIRRGTVRHALGYMKKDLGMVLRLPTPKSYKELLSFNQS